MVLKWNFYRKIHGFEKDLKAAEHQWNAFKVK